jgi:hypothetical protein
MVSTIKLEGKDLSNVRYVLGMTPEVYLIPTEMAEVLEGVVQRMKPLLKYLPCFKPLNELLNGGFLPGCAKRRTDIVLVKFPEGISERTKTVEMHVLEEADVETTSTRKSLLLTDDGKILIWSAVYDRIIGLDEICKSTKGRDEIAKDSRFEIFGGEKLKDLISRNYSYKLDWNKIILKILDRLSREMDECIKEREGYLQSMKEGRDTLNKTRYRIQRPS